MIFAASMRSGIISRSLRSEFAHVGGESDGRVFIEHGVSCFLVVRGRPVGVAAGGGKQREGGQDGGEGSEFLHRTVGLLGDVCIGIRFVLAEGEVMPMG